MFIDDIKVYIINLIVSNYNKQFGTKYLNDDFEIMNISSLQNTDCGFEVYTKREDDYLRLRFYATYANQTIVGRFSYYVEKNSDIPLGDEIFVANGYLNIDNLGDRARVILKSCPAFDLTGYEGILLDENNLAFITGEDGTAILLEG